MEILDGKCVANKIKEGFEERIQKCKDKGKTPYIAVLGLNGNKASDVYIKRIEKNCKKYGIKFELKMADTEADFRKNFYDVKNNDKITGVMFQQPISKGLTNLINELPYNKDVEGISIENMGKIMLGSEDAIIPCTSKAVIEVIKYYNIDLSGKRVTIIGRSNIVGKPLFHQVLKENATITVCHSKTVNIEEETKKADVVIIAIGNAKFLKKEYIKDNAIIIDVGMNFENGNIVGDVDFEDIKDKCKMCTPVPGGIGVVTNALLIDNIIKSCEMQV